MKNQLKTIAIPDFLTESQISRAMQCKSAKEIKEKVISPDFEHIEARVGQECDPMYLAYCCERVFREAGIWR